MRSWTVPICIRFSKYALVATLGEAEEVLLLQRLHALERLRIAEEGSRVLERKEVPIEILDDRIRVALGNVVQAPEQLLVVLSKLEELLAKRELPLLELTSTVLPLRRLDHRSSSENCPPPWPQPALGLGGTVYGRGNLHQGGGRSGIGRRTLKRCEIVVGQVEVGGLGAKVRVHQGRRAGIDLVPGTDGWCALQSEASRVEAEQVIQRAHPRDGGLDQERAEGEERRRSEPPRPERAGGRVHERASHDRS